jgi:hypothetical protein
MNVETIRYRSKKQGSKHGVRTVVGKDPTKNTSFLPHTIEDKLNKAAKNFGKFVKDLKD